MWTNVPIRRTRPWEFPNKYFHTTEHISVRLLRSSNPNSETEHVCHPYKSTLIYFSIATYLNGGRNRVRSGIDLCSIKDEIMSLFGFGEILTTAVYRAYSLPPRRVIMFFCVLSPASVKGTAGNYRTGSRNGSEQNPFSGSSSSDIFNYINVIHYSSISFCRI